MINSKKGSTNWFEDGGESYAQFRPKYPKELAQYLASICANHVKAIDIGCGNGQLTTGLAEVFKSVIGVDPSLDQINHAEKRSNISYLLGSAENIPHECAGADLMTVAQAAHWFDLDIFYKEVRKTAQPSAILALITYGVAELEPSLNERFLKFYYDEIGKYWPPERKLVDEGYRNIPFPFSEQPPPKIDITVEWDLNQFLGYISTWSAVRAMKNQGQEVILSKFGDDITELWGPPTQKRKIKWPLNLRVGKL